MCFFSMAQQRKGLAKLGMQFIRAITHDRQAAALVWPVFGKGGDDDVTAGLDRTKHGLYISGTIFRRGQEMEHGAIVPDIESPGGQIRLGDIRLDPLYLGCL